MKLIQLFVLCAYFSCLTKHILCSSKLKKLPDVALTSFISTPYKTQSNTAQDKALLGQKLTLYVPEGQVIRTHVIQKDQIHLRQNREIRKQNIQGGNAQTSLARKVVGMGGVQHRSNSLTDFTRNWSAKSPALLNDKIGISTIPRSNSAGTMFDSAGSKSSYELRNVVKNPKTQDQLRSFEDWELRKVNSRSLNSNCYYCMAAGLSGLNTEQLAKITKFYKILQNANFIRTNSVKFTDINSLQQYQNDKITSGSSQKFGLAYYHAKPVSGISGHMVGMKTWKNTNGVLESREVDFQLKPENRFPQSKKLNKYTPPGPGPYILFDIDQKDLKRVPLDQLRHHTNKKSKIPDSTLV